MTTNELYSEVFVHQSSEARLEKSVIMLKTCNNKCTCFVQQSPTFRVSFSYCLVFPSKRCSNLSRARPVRNSAVTFRRSAQHRSGLQVGFVLERCSFDYCRSPVGLFHPCYVIILSSIRPLCRDSP
jgi:hypothetical protein